MFSRTNLSLEMDQFELGGTVRASTVLPPITGTTNPRVERSMLTYLIQSYLHYLFKDESKSLQEKTLSSREFGRKLGGGYVEVLSEGAVEKLLYNRDGKSVKTQQ